MEAVLAGRGVAANDVRASAVELLPTRTREVVQDQLAPDEDTVEVIPQHALLLWGERAALKDLDGLAHRNRRAVVGLGLQHDALGDGRADGNARAAVSALRVSLLSEEAARLRFRRAP